MNVQKFKIDGKEISVQIRDEADESVAAEIFKIREYRIADELMKQIDLPIIDIGAHAGFFTIYARLINQKSPIIAVEPEKNNIQALAKNLEMNNIAGVQVVEGAVASKTGKGKLLISNDSHNHHLLSEDDKNGEEVVVYSLSDLLKKCIIKRIGLIKLDIEGTEFEIVEALSAEEFLNIKAFIMEYHNDAGRNHKTIESILRESGFGVQVFPSKFDKSMGFLYAVNKRF